VTGQTSERWTRSINADQMKPVRRPHSRRWADQFNKLAEFKADNGHCNAPDSWPENLRLARWMMPQRQMYRKWKLSEDWIQRLEAIGFIWCRQEHAWDEMYERLVRYGAVCGDCNDPLGWQEGPQLGSWGVKQRHLKSKELLKDERMKKLEELGMRW
jgi:hypothetical protein